MWLLFLLFLGESSGMLLVRHKQLLCVYTDTFGFGKQVNCMEAWMCRVSGPAGQFSSAPAHYVLVAFPPYLGVFLARYFCVCVCALMASGWRLFLCSLCTDLDMMSPITELIRTVKLTLSWTPVSWALQRSAAWRKRMLVWPADPHSSYRFWQMQNKYLHSRKLSHTHPVLELQSQIIAQSGDLHCRWDD